MCIFTMDGRIDRARTFHHRKVETNFIGGTKVRN